MGVTILPPLRGISSRDSEGTRITEEKHKKILITLFNYKLKFQTNYSTHASRSHLMNKDCTDKIIVLDRYMFTLIANFINSLLKEIRKLGTHILLVFPKCFIFHLVTALNLTYVPHTSFKHFSASC